MSEGSGSFTVQDAPSLLHPSFDKEKLEAVVHDHDKPSDANFVEPSNQGLARMYDGGRRAWLTIFGAWMIQFCTYGYVSAFGIYQDYYTRVFLSQETPSNISWIGSFQLFMQYAPGFLIGRAFDAGYFHHMIALGTILQVFSMLMLSLARQHHYYQVFLTQALGMGLGQSLLFLPSLTIIGHHFKRRRALATGISVSGASVGGIVWPILLNQLSQRTSFANAIRVTAALNGVMLLASNFLMKTSPTQQGLISRNPDFRAIFTDSAYLVSIASAFCINLGLFFPYFYLQLYAVDLGIDSTEAFYSIAIVNAGSVLGRLLPNFFADKIGPYNMLLPCLFISSAVAFAMFGVSNFTGVILFGLFYGFWSGSYVSLIPSLLAQLSTHVGEQGTRMGIAFSIVGISMLVGTPIEGGLLRNHDAQFSWSKSIIFCGYGTMWRSRDDYLALSIRLSGQS
ncbi:hypothetical protein GALMADRAFT_564664 [Galerina marginata CBS 339.88]|uniref:Major facilitator superfamily (MFS) profile domain-containing protein n=1 Tax=Galerina marginata (strain CBS 339.88) TaxID=685588 RepID=A0A067SXP6_GALM3|nr:hypothetical protein GALMADRAFT_564664 [Galerina marginata CBS 339.88]